MKVILRQDIRGVGQADGVVTVAPGYARNYLFPRRLAVEATEPNLRELEKRHRVVEHAGEKALTDSQEIAERLSQVTITVHGKAGSGTRLYGSITPQDIAEAIKAQTGTDIDKRRIHIQEPIKTAGTHSVPVRLHRDVGFDLKLEVVAE